MRLRTSITGVPGMNMRLLGLGVCCVWMNMPRRCSPNLNPAASSTSARQGHRAHEGMHTCRTHATCEVMKRGEDMGRQAARLHQTAVACEDDKLLRNESLAPVHFRRATDPRQQ